MDKLLDSRHEGHVELGQATLLFDDAGGLTKTAAAAEIDSFVKDIPVRDGFFYLHINAMGAGEYYGSNRNGDYFPEAQLIRWHKTFETSPAHVFRHHVNKDPAKSIGKVIFSYYNPRMHRVELIVEVSKVLGADEYMKITQLGQYPATSMACNTPFDVCSICGNKAHSRLQYCTHLTTQLNTLYPDGRKVMALNLGPLKFFDISIVIRPADVTSSVLEKVANHQGVISSVEAAEAEGLMFEEKVVTPVGIKKEAVEKLADLIKQVDGDVANVDTQLDRILDRILDPEDSLISVLQAYPFAEVLNAFAELGMNPSMGFWSKYFARMYLGKEHMGALAMAVADHVGPAALPIDPQNIPEIEEKEASPMLIKLLVKYVEGSSYRTDMVEKRAAAYIMGKPGVPSGYTNWELGRLPPPTIKMDVPVEEQDPSLLNTLLTIAGSALLAKYMIAGLVKRKLEKSNSWIKMPSVETIVKSAEVTVKLMEGSIKRHCRRVK
jgi:hypothetical protein